jgi:hypothetical protein
MELLAGARPMVNNHKSTFRRRRRHKLTILGLASILIDYYLIIGHGCGLVIFTDQ